MGSSDQGVEHSEIRRYGYGAIATHTPPDFLMTETPGPGADGWCARFSASVWSEHRGGFAAATAIKNSATHLEPAEP